MTKALFFAPHSFIWIHAYPEALVAEALVVEGFDVHYVGCGKALSSWCVSMESTGAQESMPQIEKSIICAKCVQNKKHLIDHFGFSTSDLISYLIADDIKTIEKILQTIRREDIIDFKINGLEIGRASLYNFVLNRKKQFSKGFSDAELADFLISFRSTLISYYAGRRLLEQHQPEKVIFYSSSYSANLVVRMQAEQLGIDCFSIYAGPNWHNRLQRIHISSTDSFKAYRDKLALWADQHKFLPATQEALDSALVFNKALIAGKHIMVYGGGNRKLQPYEIKEKWGIPSTSTVLFIATSSYDELYAAQSIKALPENPVAAFKSQIEWIKSTIEYVERRKNLSLIIRVHPRELPNRRETIGSEHSLQLKAILSDLPGNVKVNWPDDGMSFYDWLEIIDVGLNSWSSAGKEFALWGLPHVSYTEDISFYPKTDLGFVGVTESEYFKKIEYALALGWSADRILLAYRWLAYELEGSVFDISDAIRPNLIDRSLVSRAIGKLTRNKWDHLRWFSQHKSPLKTAALIKQRISSDRPSEDILEPSRVRLSIDAEKTYILGIVAQICEVRFGENWQQQAGRSNLLNNLSTLLKQIRSE